MGKYFLSKHVVCFTKNKCAHVRINRQQPLRIDIIYECIFKVVCWLQVFSLLCSSGSQKKNLKNSIKSELINAQKV